MTQNNTRLVSIISVLLIHAILLIDNGVWRVDAYACKGCEGGEKIEEDSCVESSSCDAGNCEVLHYPTVYACHGSFGTVTAGIDDGNNLCAEGYEVCDTADYAESLGLTLEECQSVRFNDVFFATAQSGQGSETCDKEGTGTDDIWGCAKHDTGSNDVHTLFDNSDVECGVLNAQISTKNANTNGWSGDNWDFYADSGTNEKDNVELVDGQYGGVLCCFSFSSVQFSPGAQFGTNEDGNGKCGTSAGFETIVIIACVVGLFLLIGLCVFGWKHRSKKSGASKQEKKQAELVKTGSQSGSPVSDK